MLLPDSAAVSPPVARPAQTVARIPRCTIGLRHYRHYREPAPFSPTLPAVHGALDIYLEGQRHDDVGRMLFGLSILRSASVGQVQAALAAAGATIGLAAAHSPGTRAPTLALAP